MIDEIDREELDEIAERTEHLFERGDAFLRKRYGDDAPAKHPELLAAYVAATARLQAAQIAAESGDGLNDVFAEALEQAAAEAALEAEAPTRNKRKR